MFKNIVCEGDTLDLAIEKGLKELDLSIDEVEYEILEEGQSILNVVLKPYRIRMKPKACNHSDINSDESEDAKIEIEITKDLLNAYMTIIPPKGGEMITHEEVHRLLSDKNITYGILDKNINDSINNSCFDTKILVAEGDKPVNGLDGYIKYFFETNQKIRPKVLENGRVDFKDLNIIKNVNKGDLLAEKILPTKGNDGKTVTGKIIKAKPGKPAYFKIGKNVIENEDQTVLIAAEDGCPKVLNDRITVLKIYEINGNVDNSTGNIYFNGKIIIKGNVCTGFKIQCDGDVEVFGVVEGAEIDAGGDIILHKGIQGHNKGKLFSKKNITASYIENAIVNAHGSIYSDVVLHSVLESKDSIQVTGKKGMLVGGESKAKKEISANSIGSPMATTTRIEVGLDPELREKYENIKEELNLLYKNRESVIKAIELLTKISKSANLPEDKKEILQKSIKTRAYLEEKIQKNKSSLLDLQEIIQSLSEGKIHANNTIFPGVKISIGSSSLYVRDKIIHATVFKEESEIKTTSYMKNDGE